jgi:Tfp pilus assembly protein PilV
MSLVEAMVAVAVLGIAMVGMMSGISYMRFENRASSQRMLVASMGAQILEQFKALPYNDIACSTGTAPIYLEGMGTTTPNSAWYVPQSGQWQTLPVEDVNSTSSATPTIVPNKIPQGVWSVQITSPATPPGLKQITVTINWQLYAGTTRPLDSYSISTVVCSGFPNL